MISFYQKYFQGKNACSPSEILNKLEKITPRKVEKALANAGNGTIDDFLALLSPIALPYLEEIAQKSQTLTRKRFGNVIQLFLPIYLSNACNNVCSYCGFSYTNKVNRITLATKDIENEILAVKKLGFQHLVLLTGEDNKNVGLEYFKSILPLFKKHFANIALEVQPLEIQEYLTLRNLGLDAVFIYQETYHQDHYRKYHPKGKKSNFRYRLETPERLGKSGIHKIGLGALLGLEDWRVDSFFTALHFSYLKEHYWKTRFSISFPRLRPALGRKTNTQKFISDKQLAQLIFAYRLLDEDLELSLSTREPPSLRNNLVPLGITSISAGSKTNPGAYSGNEISLEQFEIDDTRSPQEIVKMLQKKQLAPVFLDWSKAFTPR